MRGRGIPGSGPRWVLLASALALLGVVVAAHGGGSTASAIASPHSTTSPSKASHPTSTHRSVHAATTTTRRRAAHSPAATSEATALGVLAGSGTHRGVVATPSSSSSAEPVPTTTTTTLGPTVSPEPTTPASEQIDQGWLEGPFSVTASYPRTSATGGTIRATWDTASTLTFSYSCSAGADSITGSSGLNLTIPGGSCQVTITGPHDVPPTSFTLDLGAT